MIRNWSPGLLTLASLFCLEVPARADVFIRAPFVTLRIVETRPRARPPVAVAIPGIVDVYVSGSVPVGAPPPVPERLPPVVSVPVPVERPAVASPSVPLEPSVGTAVPVPPPPTVVRPIRHEDFAATFQPAPGTYEVVFLHPGSRCPVKVCFTLPEGCPRQVRVSRRSLEFDYGRECVRIRFQIGGKVKVLYD